MTAPTTKDLTSVWCTPGGEVYAVDVDGDAHELQGHAARFPWERGGPLAIAGDSVYQVMNEQLRRSTDSGKSWSAVPVIKLAGRQSYGRYAINAVAASDGGRTVYALGSFTAVSNSLENAFAYLLRSDDGGATWSPVWTGPDSGPAGGRRSQGPNVGSALAVLTADVVALAAVDGAVLISTDGGRTFAQRQTPATATLANLWVSPTGVLYGVGHHGEVVASSDGGKTFAATPSGAATALAAVTGCGPDVWIVGARGTVLRR